MTNSIGWRVRMQFFFSRYVTRARPHEFIYRLTGGLIGSRLPSVKPNILLITVRGRKTGQAHTTPLVCFQIGQQVVVAATNHGKDSHPAWYLNLQFNPNAVIQVGRSRRDVRASLAQDAERERLWSAIIAMHTLFAEYQRRTNRKIPVIVLDVVGEHLLNNKIATL